MVLALFLLAPGRVQAQTAGAAFLRIDADARVAAMGGAGAALASGPTAMPYNPAGLAATRAAAFGFTHTNWVLATRHDHAAVALPLSKFGIQRAGGLGLSVTHLGLSGVDSRDESGKAGGDLAASDASYALGAALPGLPYSLSGGVSLKLIRSSVGSFSATTFAADVGVRRDLRWRGAPVSAGLALRNAGPGLKFDAERDPLPTSLAFGMGTTVQRSFKISADVSYYPHEARLNAAVGTEFSPLPALALRAGFEQAALSGLGGGFGIAVGGYRLDYGFTPFGELGAVHRIGLSMGF